MVQCLAAIIGAVVTNNAVVTMIEDEAAHAIHLVTLPGHFAHPSIAQRALVARDGEPGVMSAWLGQFRAQDERVRQSYARQVAALHAHRLVNSAFNFGTTP